MRHSSTFRTWLFAAVVTAVMMAAFSGLLAFASARPALAQAEGRYTTAPVRTSGSQSLLGPEGLLFPIGANRNITNKNGAQSESAVAVDPTNPAHIVAASNDLSNFSSYNNVFESFNFGRTWTNAGFSVNAFCYDPWLDFNADGTVLFAYECSDQRVAHRTAGGSWVYKTLTNAGGFPDRDMIVVDRNPASPYPQRAYIGYDDANASNAAYLLYSNGTNYGSNWVRSPKINDASSTIGVNAAVLADGRVAAVWEEFAADRLRSDCSTDGGATWGTDTTVHIYRSNAPQFFIFIPPQPQRGVLPLPFSDAAPAGTTYANRLYLTYADQAVSGSHWDVFFRYSDNCGATWSAEIKVNDDTGNAYQFHPDLAVMPNGTIAVSWSDTRDDLPNNEKTHRYLSYSADGGVTWSANERITTGQSDESGFGDANDYGDYQMTAASNTDFFYHVWTDSRPGTNAEDMVGAPSRP